MAGALSIGSERKEKVYVPVWTCVVPVRAGNEETLMLLFWLLLITFLTLNNLFHEDGHRFPASRTYFTVLKDFFHPVTAANNKTCFCSMLFMALNLA